MSFILDFSNFFLEDNYIDDPADKVARQWMSFFMIFLLVFLGLKQFVGDPIQCFTPQYFSGGQEMYVDGYCWTASTYQIVDTKYDPLRPHDAVQAVLEAGPGHEFDEAYNENTLKGSKRLVSYYQWIPLIITLQAILFTVPYLFWKSCSADAGVDIEQITKACGLLGECEGDPHERHHTLKNIADMFNLFIKVTKPPKDEDEENYCCFIPGRLAKAIGLKGAVHYCFMYITYKCLVILNIALQLYGMHKFLGTSLIAHGLNVFYCIFVQQKWTSSERFPINTVCEFRGQPQIHGYLITYNAHCVLPINLYNDKLYAIMSLLFLGTMLYSLKSLVHWLRLLICRDSRIGVIKDHLILDEQNEKFDDFDAKFNDFVDKELKPDGAFLINMIDDNLGGAVTHQLVTKLWNCYMERLEPEDHNVCKLEHFKQETLFDGEDFRMKIEPECTYHGKHTVRYEEHKKSFTHKQDYSAPPYNNNDEKIYLNGRSPTDV